MTSRERILTAIAHKTPDRIPVDLGATPSSGISAIAYSNLVKHLGRPDLPVQVYDVVQQLAQPDMSILDQFGIDVLDIGRTFNVQPSDWKPTTLANGAAAFYPRWFNPVKLNDGSFATYDNDGKTMLSRMPLGATFFDQTYFPYVDGYPDSYENLDAEMSRIMWARDAHSPWDHAGEPDFWQKLRENTLELRKNTDKALLVVCGCNLFEWGTFLRRMDNFLMDLMCDPYNVEKLLDQLMIRHLATLEKVCNAVGDIVDIIRFGDDLGMSSGPFMDVEIYRDLFKPRHKMLCDYVKTHSKMHTFIHSCGSISLLMPHMIEAGIEIFNPVQTKAWRMEPRFLKKEFGKDCTFWGGGIETVGTLNNGTPAQVREQVLERLEIFSEGGGFVFNTVHNILPDVPPENVVAMYDAVKNLITIENNTEMKPKSTFCLLSLSFFVMIVMFSCSPQKTSNETIFPEDHSAKLEWWKDARFGMFIHWGPVSLKGTEIGWSRGREIPVSTYDSLYLQFNPVNFNAEDWVLVAKAAGMKYIVFTSKHHDGFCNWDTKYTDYNIMNSPFKRDVMAELAAACKKHGMALGFYHSTCDWHHPDFPLTSPGGKVVREVSNIDRYNEYLKNQSVEIIKNYGPLLVMWYDVPQRFDSIRGQGVIDVINQAQPGILVNNRTGAKGDFDTPEQRVGSFQNDRPWETCMTIAHQWAWKPDDVVKSTEQCLHSLIRSAGGDGNLLFNVGPKPDGTIEPLQVERLKEMGAWLKEYGFSIYGTRGGPFKPTDWGVSTRKDNKIYLHILNLPGTSPKIVLPDFGMEITKCSVVGGGALNFSKVNDEIVIEFGSEPIKPINTIVEIEVSENAIEITPMDVKPASLSFKKPVTGSSNLEPHWSNHQWVDIKSVTNGDWVGDFWHPAEDDVNPWVEIDLGTFQNVKGAVIYEREQKIKAFEFQYKSGNEWKTLFTGTGIGEKAVVEFPETQVKQLRFVIKEFAGMPGIYEIAMF